MSLSLELAEYFETKILSRHSVVGNVQIHDKAFENVDIHWDGTTLWGPSHVLKTTRERKMKEIQNVATTIFHYFAVLFHSIYDRFTMQKELELRDIDNTSFSASDGNQPGAVVEKSGNNDTTDKNEVEEDSLLIGAASIPVYRAISLRVILFVALDTVANYALINDGLGSITLSIVMFIIVIVYYMLCLFVRPRFIHDRYHGNILNSLLGLRCDCPPGRYLRDAALPIIACSMIFKISGWMMLQQVIDSSSKENVMHCIHGGVCWFEVECTDPNSTVSNCTNFNFIDPVNKTYHDYLGTFNGTDICGICDGSIAISLLTFMTPMVMTLEFFIIFSTYSDLTTAAQQAVLVQAKRVEKFHHPLTEEILTKAEVQYGYVPGLREHRPLVYFFTWCVALAFSIVIVGPLFEQEMTYVAKHKHLSVQEFLTFVFIILIIMEMIFIIAEVSNSLYTTYHNCLCRMHLLSNSLQEILDDALVFTYEQAGTSLNTTSALHSSGKKKLESPDDVNFHSRLNAWFRARRFFMDLVFPLTFTLCNLSLLGLSLAFLGFSVFSGVQFVQLAQTNVQQALEESWSIIVFTLWVAIGLISVISKAADIWVKKSSQIRMMKEFLMETKLARQKNHEINCRLNRMSSLVMNSVKPKNVQEEKFLEKGKWWLRKIRDIDDGDQENIRDNDDNDDGSGGCGLNNFCDGLESMISYAERYDVPATVMTIPVTPLFVASAIGYIISGFGAIILSLLYSRMFG